MEHCKVSYGREYEMFDRYKSLRQLNALIVQDIAQMIIYVCMFIVLLNNHFFPQLIISHFIQFVKSQKRSNQFREFISGEFRIRPIENSWNWFLDCFGDFTNLIKCKKLNWGKNCLNMRCICMCFCLRFVSSCVKTTLDFNKMCKSIHGILIRDNEFQWKCKWQSRKPFNTYHWIIMLLFGNHQDLHKI